MKGFALIAMIFAVFLAAPALAQDGMPIAGEPTRPRPLGEVSDVPHCFNVINKAPYTVFGSINTNYFINADSVKTRHKSNFRLEYDDYAEFCTYGPFYEGGKVELVLRTLIPIFNCKTAVHSDIIIYGRRKAEGGTETWAACL